MDATHISGACFFFIAAVVLLLRRRHLLDYGRLYPRWGVPRVHRPRIDAAFTVRATSDTFDTRPAGYATGALSLASTPLVLLTDIPFNTVLGALIFALAVSLGLTVVLQPRPSGRVAVSPRDDVRGVPWYVWTIVAALAVAPLLWFAIAPIGATLFSCASLTLAAIAYRFATRPARLAGDDPSVERFVDGRIRTTRVAILCALAIVPAYVFEASSFGDYTWPMHAVLFIAPLGAILCNVHISRAARLMRAA